MRRLTTLRVYLIFYIFAHIKTPQVGSDVGIFYYKILFSALVYFISIQTTLWIEVNGAIIWFIKITDSFHLLLCFELFFHIDFKKDISIN